MILDMEPTNAALFAARPARRAMPAYIARKNEEIVASLDRFFAKQLPGAVVSGVHRVGGGASKEQFVFLLAQDDGPPEKFLLRMDPLEAITETSRKREFEILNAVQGLIPAPKPRWMDEDGDVFGRPCAIMEFSSGVTKPSGAGLKVSGLGTWLGEPLRSRLKGPFLDNMVKLHGFDWRNSDALPSFAAPDADPKQAARWSYNYWIQLLIEDLAEPLPIVSYTSQWLWDNMPDTTELCLIHCDYRTGNYLFNEERGEIIAVLDWEMARIGDYHEDLAWTLMQIFGTFENGRFRASDLWEREEFISAYETATGRVVNRATLHYYDVMSSWKCYIIVHANGMTAARHQHNHQDVLLTFLAATGAMFTDDLVRLHKQGVPA